MTPARIMLGLIPGSTRSAPALRATCSAPNVENLTGTAATGQTSTGNALNNVIAGGVGNDTLNGGLGNDTFIFTANHAGDRLSDFTEGDIIEFRSTGITSFAQLQTYMTEWEGTTHIAFNATTSIALTNVAMSSLEADDFRFI
jgi:serralysin